MRVLLLALCAALLHPSHAMRGDRDLPGWQGETYRGTPSLRGGNVRGRDTKRWIEHLSWSPRSYLYHNFLTKEETLHLIHLAAPTMVKSTVVDNASGKSMDSRIRTSSGTFLRRGQDKVVQDIERRIAEFSMIPVENGEGFQVLHYEQGQKYEAHFDYFHDQLNVKNGGQRVATMLLYLTDVEEGGETVFPSSEVPAGAAARGFSPCGQKGVATKPKAGDALLFWSLKTDGTQDAHSLHAGCPVLRGDKWSATKWMRVGRYNAP